MNRTARLAAYALLLAFVFGGGAALGAAVGPDPDPAPAEPMMMGDRGSSPDGPSSESDR